MKKPNFFIIGAPKCGTTALQSYLAQHPDVFMPLAKELHYFGSDLTFQVRRRSEREYLSFFQQARDQKWIGEASVWYLYSETAAREIKDFNPSARIIVMLRNPVDMLHSLHNQYLYNGKENFADFEAALAAEQARRSDRDVRAVGAKADTVRYRDAVRYCQQVKRYHDVFGPENVHIILFDDFSIHPEQVYRGTLRFLNIDSSRLPNFPVVNGNKMARSRLLTSIMSGRAFAPIRSIAGLLPDFVKYRLVSALRRYNTVYVERPPMPPAVRQRLQAEFRPEIEELSRLLGRDLRHWWAD